MDWGAADSEQSILSESNLATCLKSRQMFRTDDLKSHWLKSRYLLLQSWRQKYASHGVTYNSETRSPPHLPKGKRNERHGLGNGSATCAPHRHEDLSSMFWTWVKSWHGGVHLQSQPWGGGNRGITGIIWPASNPQKIQDETFTPCRLCSTAHWDCV